jgi:IMP dehydrogenase
MDSVTEWRLAVEMARLGGAGVIHRNMSVDDQVGQVRKTKACRVNAISRDNGGRPLVGAAVSPLDARRCKALDQVADFLVADVAHFHSSKIIEAARRILPDLSADFVAGNVGTGKAVEEIADELPRVEGFRAGIGSGSICITSEVTRVGAPTLFAVAEVASGIARRKLDVPVIADGGVRGPGDAALAFGAGASTVMLGSMLAGTEEASSKVVLRDGKRFKIHRGMASAAARKVRFAVDRYAVPAKGLDEGVEAYVPFVGKAEHVVAKMANGLRAAFGYAGAENVQGMWTGASFGLVSTTGERELGAHSLEVKD